VAPGKGERDEQSEYIVEGQEERLQRALAARVRMVVIREGTRHRPSDTRENVDLGEGPGGDFGNFGRQPCVAVKSHCAV